MSAYRIPESKIAAVILLSSPKIICEYLTYRSVGEIVDLGEQSVRHIRNAALSSAAGVDPIPHVFSELGRDVTADQAATLHRDGARLICTALEARQAADTRRIKRFSEYLSDLQGAA